MKPYFPDACLKVNIFKQHSLNYVKCLLLYFITKKTKELHNTVAGKITENRAALRVEKQLKVVKWFSEPVLFYIRS